MRKALCIGISHQSDTNLISIPQCENDIEDFEALLNHERCKFETQKITNPTYFQLIKWIDDNIKDLDSKDELLVYFSGHGKRDSLRKLYLCTSDTNSEQLVISALCFDQLLSIIRERIIGSVCIILDCCYSGAVKESVLKGDIELLEPPSESYENTRGLTIFTSTSAVDSSIVNKNDRNSVFTSNFISICKELLRKEKSDITTLDIMSKFNRNIQDNMFPFLQGDNLLFKIFEGTKNWNVGVKDKDVNNTLRILQHESSQIIACIEGLWLVNFSDINSIKRLVTQNRIHKVNSDFNAMLSSLRFVMDNSKLTTLDQLTPHYSQIDLRNSLLRIVHILESQAKFKNTNVILGKVDRFLLYTDSNLLDNLLYNVVNNAITYGYRGTNIYLNYTVDNVDNNLTINVKNYGDKINSGSDIFNIYSRGENAKSIEGLGIGLFVSKRIVDVLKGSIHYQCSLISNYNLGVIQPYIEFIEKDNTFNSFDSYPKIKKEFSELKKDRTLSYVLARNESGMNMFAPGPKTLQMEIDRPTYDITFSITIPLK